MSLQQELIAWFRLNRRDLPWRTPVRDPYATLVSELMLQQTTVAAVVPYYERWMAKFPDAATLANARDEEVMAMWQGLGYYRRARFLHQAAKSLVASGVPETYSGWLALPGVGAYTAGAVCSLVFDLPVPVVDGNVERVFARLTASECSGPQLKSACTDWATEMLPAGHPGEWNEALMELGATVCTPTSPQCDRCPLSSCCKAVQLGIAAELPKKSVKPEQKSLVHYTAIPVSRGLFGVRPVPPGKWWAGLWEFPREESLAALESIVKAQLEPVGSFKHVVTNHKIELQVFVAEIQRPDQELRWLSLAELESLPMPAPARRALTLCLRSHPGLEARASHCS